MHSTTWLNCFKRYTKKTPFKKQTNFQQPTCMKERLSVTLHHLASGDSQKSLGWAHRIGKAAISKIIKETTNAIWEALKPAQEVADWKAIFKEFENL